MTVIFGERLSCARSRHSALKEARSSRPFATILLSIAEMKLWRTILILAYPTIEALLFLLYLDNLIEPETHTSGSWPEENLLSSTVLHQAGFVTSTDVLVERIINPLSPRHFLILYLFIRRIQSPFNRASDDPWKERSLYIPKIHMPKIS